MTVSLREMASSIPSILRTFKMVTTLCSRAFIIDPQSIQNVFTDMAGFASPFAYTSRYSMSGYDSTRPFTAFTVSPVEEQHRHPFASQTSRSKGFPSASRMVGAQMPIQSANQFCRRASLRVECARMCLRRVVFPAARGPRTRIIPVYCITNNSTLMNLYESFLIFGLDRSYNGQRSHTLLTSLELLVGPPAPTYNSQLISLHADSDFYLRLGFNSGNPIHEKVPQKYVPVPVRRLDNYSHCHKIIAQTTTHVLYQGQYDLSRLLQRDQIKPSQAYVLCYSQETRSPGASPIQDIKMIISQRRSSTRAQQKQIITLPDEYKLINMKPCKTLRGRLLAYRHKTKITELVYRPLLLQEFPKKELPDISAFCFPEGLRILEEECFPSSFSFILTNASGERLYSHVLRFFEPLSEHDKNYLSIRTERILYAEKGICLISRWGFSQESHELLKHFFRLRHSRCQLKIQRIIQVIMEAKMSEDRVLVYDYGGCKIIFNAEEFSQKRNRPLYVLFRTLSLESIFILFNALLTEKKILILASSKALLSHLFEGLNMLLFPFEWVNLMVTVLPQELTAYLQSPVPFLIGCLNKRILLSLPQRGEIIVVDADTNTILNHESLPPMPQKPGKQLFKRLNPLMHMHNKGSLPMLIQFLQNPFFVRLQEEDNSTDWILVREHFLEFFTTILKNMKNYYKSGKQNFMLKEFISDLAGKQGSFISKFTDTVLFVTFFQKEKNWKHDFLEAFIERKKKGQVRVIEPNVKKQTFIKLPLQQIKEKVFYEYKEFPLVASQSLHSSPAEDPELDQLPLLLDHLARFSLLHQNYFYSKEAACLAKGDAKMLISGFGQDRQVIDCLCVQLFQNEEDVLDFIEPFQRIYLGRVKLQVCKRLQSIAIQKQGRAQKTLDMITRCTHNAKLPVFRLEIFEQVSFQSDSIYCFVNNATVLFIQHTTKNYIKKIFLTSPPKLQNDHVALEVGNPALQSWLQTLLQTESGVNKLVGFVRSKSGIMQVDMEWLNQMALWLQSSRIQ